MVGILDGLVASTFVPVGVTAVAHEAAHVVGAVLRGRPRFAKLANYADKKGKARASQLLRPMLDDPGLLYYSVCLGHVRRFAFTPVRADFIHTSVVIWPKVTQPPFARLGPVICGRAGGLCV